MSASATNRSKHYRSLREHLDALRAIGELQEIDQEVDWNLEIGAITRRIYETGGPAVLFNRIKGIEVGFGCSVPPRESAPGPVSPWHGWPHRSDSRQRPGRSKSWMPWRRPMTDRGLRRGAWTARPARRIL
jgi:hypothetical protein